MERKKTSKAKTVRTSLSMKSRMRNSQTPNKMGVLFDNSKSTKGVHQRAKRESRYITCKEEDMRSLVENTLRLGSEGAAWYKYEAKSTLTWIPTDCRSIILNEVRSKYLCLEKVGVELFWKGGLGNILRQPTAHLAKGWSNFGGEQKKKLPSQHKAVVPSIHHAIILTTPTYPLLYNTKRWMSTPSSNPILGSPSACPRRPSKSSK